MRTLDVIQEFDCYTYESPHRLVLDGVPTGVRWNGDTKRAIGDTEEFAYILVKELDYEIGGLTEAEMLWFYQQLTGHFGSYPDN